MCGCCTHTLLEVNLHSMCPTRNMVGARENICFDIANYENALPLLKEVDFPEELVMNYDADKFF